MVESLRKERSSNLSLQARRGQFAYAEAPRGTANFQVGVRARRGRIRQTHLLPHVAAGNREVKESVCWNERRAQCALVTKSLASERFWTLPVEHLIPFRMIVSYHSFLPPICQFGWADIQHIGCARAHHCHRPLYIHNIIYLRPQSPGFSSRPLLPLQQ